VLPFAGICYPDNSHEDYAQSHKSADIYSMIKFVKEPEGIQWQYKARSNTDISISILKHLNYVP